jgi:hypothetical protein
MHRTAPICLVLATLAGCGSSGGGGGSSPSPGIDTTLGTSAGTGNAGALFASRGGQQPSAFSGSAIPVLDVQLLVCTYAGGAGDQYLREVSWTGDHALTATGAGFTLSYSSSDSGATWSGSFSGDPATADGGSFSSAAGPRRGTASYTDTRHGLTYSSGYRQVDSTLQQPFASCTARGWTFWDWSSATARGQSLTADSRCYDIWPMPDGDIGIKCWSDGGNTVLNRHPRVITAANEADDGSWQNGANSMGTYYLRANPLTGKPISGTFLRGVHATYHAMDPWGRIYIPRTCTKAFPTVSPSNPFGHSSSSSAGLFVLSPDLDLMQANLRLGGTPSGLAGTYHVLRKIALRGNLLALVGTTSAVDMPTTGNAAQAAHGGGSQDGWLVILRLWTPPPPG